jgi:hypothetical protein
VSPIDPRTAYAGVPSLGTAQAATDLAHHLGEGPGGMPPNLWAGR